jgi:hypothetical protein
MRPSWLALASMALLVHLAGCVTADGDSATAVWELAPETSVEAASTTVSVLVTRLGCNSGVTGAVNRPDVTITAREIVVRFTVSPGEPEGGADCQGNNPVEYVLELDEPVGERRLVDGACRTTEASSTIFCESEYR